MPPQIKCRVNPKYVKVGNLFIEKSKLVEVKRDKWRQSNGKYMYELKVRWQYKIDDTNPHEHAIWSEKEEDIEKPFNLISVTFDK
jgi:hypothetical protein